MLVSTTRHISPAPADGHSTGIPWVVLNIAPPVFEVLGLGVPS